MPKYIANAKGFRNNSIVQVGATVNTDKPLDPKPSWLDLVQETTELSPQQKAAATRAAKKAAADEAAAEVPDFNAIDEPEQL